MRTININNNNDIRTININNCIRLHAAKDADMTDEEREVAMEKALKAMTAFSNKYAGKSEFVLFCLLLICVHRRLGDLATSFGLL